MMLEGATIILIVGGLLCCRFSLFSVFVLGFFERFRFLDSPPAQYNRNENTSGVGGRGTVVERSA